MVVCECVLSDNIRKHIRIIQKKLQMDSSFSSRSDTVKMLLKYMVSDVDGLSINDLILIDDYFTEHPTFLYEFNNDFMMSATFNSDSHFG